MEIIVIIIISVQINSPEEFDSHIIVGCSAAILQVTYRI